MEGDVVTAGVVFTQIEAASKGPFQGSSFLFNTFYPAITFLDKENRAKEALFSSYDLFGRSNVLY